MQRVLHTSPLSLQDWLIVVVVSLSIIVIEEIRKFLVRLFASHRTPRFSPIAPNGLK
jgi:hypothetical protein